MQPYFFPYIGYFQLMNAVDKFVVYDNIQYTKNGWINRNRILQNDKDILFTIPLKKDSDLLNVNQRILADNSTEIREKILRQIKHNYQKARYFDSIYPFVEKCFLSKETNLFNYIFFSITQVAQLFDIKTEIIISSTIDINHDLKGREKVLGICNKMNCDNYINAVGGVDLYNKDVFSKNNFRLNFLKTNKIKYQQYNSEFIPNLSIIDVLMFNSVNEIKSMINSFTLI